ncbi:uncharacterized protein LOC109536280 [Dendroctonus ponderosae]|uniref:uncharacterized protein LOC109536280 n=1 Tax=Dendroctonus ponderosae TaxID=77166 RepID=UPI002035670C|nr:uncharacterized protein LOC109536280 [Dendroctonus ponderosae]
MFEVNTLVLLICIASGLQVHSISIDGQLSVIKNDCYERLAIGEKLSPKQTYKSFEHNTVSKCEKECTKEQETCRAYSFGIGAKGNASCLLSRTPIKETVDLKPIGTTKDTDFDLYIKKIDCQIVLEAPHRPTENQHAEHSQNEAQYLVEEEHHGSGQPPNHHSPNEGYQYQRPAAHYKPNPPKEDNLQHVQTLVSIASGPNNVLHPVHDILISGRPENAYGVQPQMPSFRPSALNRPYEHHKPANFAHLGWDNYAYGYGGSGEDRKHFPDFSPSGNYAPQPLNGYESGSSQLEIDRRKYQSYTHYDSLESETHKFGSDPHYNFYDHYDRPDPSYPNRYGSVIPHPDDYSHPQSNHQYLFVRPNSAGANQEESGYKSPRPGYGGARPEDDSFGNRPEIDDRRPGFNKGDLGYEGRPSRPYYDSLRPIGYKPQEHHDLIDNHKPNKASNPDYNPASRYPTKSPASANHRPASTELTNHYEGNYNDKQYGKPHAYNEKGSIKVVAQNVGYNGEKFTSIITELENACFHRTMAGKRAVRGLVRKLSICETVEQCQQECGDERRFTCEGFNYRLDPSGRGKGECELLDLPLSRIDLIREIVPDQQYDLYTRDRNSAQVNCRLPPDAFPMGSYGNGHQYGSDENMLRPYDRRPPGIARPPKRPAGGWEDEYGGPPRPIPIDPLPLPPANRKPEYDDRRGDYSYHHSHQSHSSHSHSYHYNEHNVDRYDFHHQHEDRRPLKGIHYLPGSPKGQTLHPVIVPLDEYPKAPLPPSYPVGRYPETRPEGGLYGGRYDYRNRYENNQKNYYVPSRPQRPQIPADWGLYGGRYGIENGDSLEYQGYGNSQVYDYWGFNKLQGDRAQAGYESHPQRPPGTYLPSSAPASGGYEMENSILPAEPRRPPTFDFIRDECSLRSAAGFRLHKGIVKKITSVPNIHDCELLCVKEKAFPCASYAFRYISFADNCQLSNRNYKELDYYTDVQPDRDFDIYTMNNRHRCPAAKETPLRDESDCFWRVRSGQRLHESVVRDSLTVRSIVDCQLECLNSRRFTCRAYSFRYNPPIIGGPIDNCQLSDCPFFELNPRVDFLPEPGFEVYERGSFGHGCEPNHFSIREKLPAKQPGLKVDQLCYVGFGSAAKLLPQATVKSAYVPTELDCKHECSQARQRADFRCMTFSFVTDRTHIAHNCFLSDIIQRDLLPNVDYMNEPSSWIFTWDDYNPECTDLAHKSLDASHLPTQLRPYGNDGLDSLNPLDIWKVYSVSGWPCKRGTLCKENRAAGFWYCELDSGDNAWDYCCSPDHQCGLSNGYPYSWCYVGPTKTQWRKCSDQYYPYTDRFDNGKKPWQASGHYPPSPQSAGLRPDRPNAPVKLSPPRPSLNEYEEEFDNEFLGPPKPGGFGQPRRWPVAYLHKEMPPNAAVPSDTRPTRTEKAETSKLSAIKSLIDVIQNTEIKNVQYHISNDSNKSDDILTVKIPLPNLEEEPQSNSTEAAKRSNELSSKTSVQFQVVDNVRHAPSNERSDGRNIPISKRSQTADSPFQYPVFRRGFVTRTNLTMARTL